MVKFSQNAEAALRQPDTKVISFEMTPELKAKLSRVTAEVVDLLKANTEGPVQAYMALQFIVHAFEDRYGIRGGIIVGKDEKSQ